MAPIHHCPSYSHHGHHHGHHHTFFASNTAIVASAAAASNSKNTRDEHPSCNIWCSSCGMLRYLLAILCMVGCVLDYMLRLNLSVAIVAMVNTTHTQHINTTSQACPAALNASSDAQTTTGGGEYDWTALEQGLVLGVFFWGYIITKAIGGRAAELMGPHLTITLAVSLCGVLTLLTPTVADLSPYALAALRLLLGLIQGPLFPAMYSILSRWTPPSETARMLTITFSGAALGGLVSLGFSGTVVNALGWRWVFWGGGIVTLVWVPFWVFFVRDSPKQHPGISRRELDLLSEIHNQPRRKVPWSRIFKSRHLYILTLMEFNSVWLQGVLGTEGPTFLTTQLGIGLGLGGAVNFTMMGLGWIMSLVYGCLSDLMRKNEWMQLVNIRRLMQGIGLAVTTVSCIGVVLGGCDVPLVVAFLIPSTLGVSAGTVTYNLGAMDIAPNYAGTLNGLYGVGSIAGFFSPMYVSYLASKENGWTIIFLSTMGLYVVASLVYITGVSATEAEWNMYEEIPGDEHPTTEKRRHEKRM